MENLIEPEEDTTSKRITLTIGIPETLRKDIKIRAVNRNISLRIWVLRAIMEKIKMEDKYK